MANLSFGEDDGVWRTIGGRKVFIREGESVSSAMKRSGKFKSAKKKNEVKDESKSFSREELKEKYGTDNTDIINAGKEKEDRVALKEDKKELNLSQKQKDEGNRLSQKAKDMAKDDIKTYLNGNKDNWDSDDEFIRDLANEHNIDREEAQKMFNYQKYVNDTLNNDEYLQANRPNEYFQKMLKEGNVKTFADEIKESENKNIGKKDPNAIKDLIKVKDGTYVPVREGETKEEAMKGYNERQKEYRENLKPEVSKNLADPRRLWDQDLVDTYIEMYEKGELKGKESSPKFARDMKNMEGEPLYSPDRIKEKFSQNKSEAKETTSNSINNSLRRKAYQKYLKEHPASKMTFGNFKDMLNYKE